MNGRRVVVIGGTSGLGFAVARTVAAQAASVVVASRARDRVDKAVAALGDGATGEIVDVTDEESLRGLFRRVGAFDHLVYTAGETLMNGTLEATDLEAAKRFFGIRCFGALAAAKYAAPYLGAGGSITLTSGIPSTRPQGGTVVVSSVLSAVEGLTRALAFELAPVRVNAVVPSITRTELWDGLPDSAREDLFASVASSLLLRRVGEPHDIADAYAFLMNNDHTTGTLLTVDGGAVLV
ncbi:SDR family oxidoreductase [Streptomyces sp. TS71-3]|uniref:SDR family oxidoreductase n=1 Tax=Streptomyces sp. TS71-3 TaxID=2733862 RepID=UPI0020182B40|nr:SDR family oxidoreductase [Streptomyces sp. TS71-3]